MEIRTYTRDDFPGIVNLHNTAFPDMPATVEDYIEAEEQRDPKCKHQRWVALEDGQIVGTGAHSQELWAYHPQKFKLAGGVLPHHQRRGIGAALYERVMEGLAPFDPVELRAHVRQDHPQSLRFFEKRGFTEYMRDRESHLDVMAFDPTPYEGLEERLSTQGIEIKTLRQLEGDADRDCKVYDLEWELLEDLPDAADLTQVPFDRWHKDILESPLFLEDGYFVAIDGGAYVGMSNLWAIRASKDLNTGLTGVVRSHRRRGVATALKVRAIAYALAHGHPVIKTGNEVNNRPMLSINERLGFVPRPEWITLRKMLREE
ncbi:MAG: GNAT family N-acetyltransferase [Anaerolineae bacterium]|jgi:GNAT superfamily N-acetyltransferase